MLATNDMTVKELRRLAIETDIIGKTGLKIQGSKKPILIEAINSGIWPEEVATVEPKADVTTVAPTNNNDVGKVLADIIKGHLNLDDILKPSVDEHTIRGWVVEARDAILSEEKIKEVIEGYIPRPTVVDVVSPKGDVTKMGVQHKLFPKILRLANIRENIWMTGPAGGGKTTMAQKIAEAMKLDFYPVSVCKQTTVYNMMGYMDGDKHMESEAYKAYTRGGVLLVDEVDGGSANVTMSLNAILANGVANFPNGIAHKHPNFICMAGANTMGHGATREYVGRNPLDEAFLSRFGAKLNFDYDEELEQEISGDVVWAKRVQKLRLAAKVLGIKCVISPRASISGANMMKNGGFEQSEVEDMVIFNGIGLENAKRIKDKAEEL